MNNWTYISVITTTLNDQNHISENCIRSVIYFFILTQVPFVYMERVGFMTCTAASHQGALKEPAASLFRTCEAHPFWTWYHTNTMIFFVQVSWLYQCHWKASLQPKNAIGFGGMHGSRPEANVWLAEMPHMIQVSRYAFSNGKYYRPSHLQIIRQSLVVPSLVAVFWNMVAGF